MNKEGKTKEQQQRDERVRKGRGGLKYSLGNSKRGNKVMKVKQKNSEGMRGQGRAREGEGRAREGDGRAMKREGVKREETKTIDKQGKTK